jgi:hypothetical protein
MCGIALLLLLGSCGQNGTGGDPAITSVAIDAPPATLSPSQDVVLHATVQGTGAFNNAVTWSVEGGGTFADAGANPATFTAPAVTTETVVSVTVTSVADPTKSHSAQIAVTPGDLGPLQPRVEPSLEPADPTIPDQGGTTQPVARSEDATGVQSDFVAGVVLVRPASQEQLDAFLARYEGVVLSNDTVPEPPPQLGITLTDEQRRPVEYRVKINLAKVDPSDFAADAAFAGVGGRLSFSSQDGLLTLAGVADAVVAGFDASPDFISQPQQAFPTTLLRTNERPTGATFTDAFATTQFQTSGSQSNVTRAWQFVAAHGIQRRTTVAIIDDGFWLQNGAPRGTDSDLPANPIQYDFINGDYIADGANGTGCGPGNPCFWHGTGAAGVATGIINNNLGDGGTGGMIADPMLFKTGGQRSNINLAIRTAVAWGADVVSMSFGGNCNLACRQYDREHTPISDAVGGGSRIVFVAAAGNGAGNPAVGYDVGDPNFVHPCHEDHVICVGALADNTTAKIGYSNFGGRVTIFAPTNIPVMSQPASTDSNPAGPAAATTFGGTSASTPFVAGVAAMMKAINPNLSGDDVARILIETAHPAGGPNVTRVIDAYAAVRSAAENIPAVRDRFETGTAGNNIVERATPLNGGGPYNQPNLNIDKPNERDFFAFEVPGQSVMTLNLQNPDSLAGLSLVAWDTDGGCGLPTFISQGALAPAGTGVQYMYNIPGGIYKVAVTGTNINAYNLGISFATPVIAADSYEPNDMAATAEHLFSFSNHGTGLLRYYGISPKVTINANLHASTDHDYYIVRGVQTTVADQVLYKGFSGVKVYGNESPLTMEVFKLKDDGTTEFVVTQANTACAAGPLAVPLEADLYYLVHLSGSPGRYTLFNGMHADPRNLPDLVRDHFWDVIHPGDPIEFEIRWRIYYAFAVDPAYSKIRAEGLGVRMRLYDINSALIAESVPEDDGFEAIDLTTALRDQIYALEVLPPTSGPTVVRLSWESTTPVRTSGNLIVNPGAEDGQANDANGAVDTIPGWSAPADINIQGAGGLPMSTVIYYNGFQGVPTADSPGPDDRGEQLFAGGFTEASGIAQGIVIDDSWKTAVSEGRAQVNFGAYLGGTGEEGDYATAIVTFVNANLQELGRVELEPVTSLERDGITGLLPVTAAANVPPGTYGFAVYLSFVKQDLSYNDGYADNLELILTEY